jgi:hypothetical protein
MVLCKLITFLTSCRINTFYELRLGFKLFAKDTKKNAFPLRLPKSTLKNVQELRAWIPATVQTGHTKNTSSVTARYSTFAVT